VQPVEFVVTMPNTYPAEAPSVVCAERLADAEQYPYIKDDQAVMLPLLHERWTQGCK
jgi:ubiquitin-protein ligase